MDLRLQKFVEEVRNKGADIVVLLSHDGFTVDQAVAKMVNGIDVILCYRWGTTLLPGDDITVDDVYSMTAITYPDVYRFEMTGSQIKNILEDIADNVFNSNPLYQQGGDMSRTLGLEYEIRINGEPGKRLSNIKVNGKDLNPNRNYVVAAWGGNMHRAGKNIKKLRPVYDITIDYIKRVKVVNPPQRSNVKIVDYPCGCPDNTGRC